jgi:hypothetical protein
MHNELRYQPKTHAISASSPPIFFFYEKHRQKTKTF